LLGIYLKSFFIIKGFSLLLPAKKWPKHNRLMKKHRNPEPGTRNSGTLELWNFGTIKPEKHA